MNYSRRVLRFPETPVRFLTSIMEHLPRFPLKTSRINALTSRCYYDSKKITETLGFEFNNSLELSFESYAANLVCE